MKENCSFLSYFLGVRKNSIIFAQQNKIINNQSWFICQNVNRNVNRGFFLTVKIQSTIVSNAVLAQLVEHWLPKPRVAGSSPVSRSVYKTLKFNHLNLGVFLYFINDRTRFVIRVTKDVDYKNSLLVAVGISLVCVFQICFLFDGNRYLMSMSSRQWRVRQESSGPSESIRS